MKNGMEFLRNKKLECGIIHKQILKSLADNEI